MKKILSVLLALAVLIPTFVTALSVSAVEEMGPLEFGVNGPFDLSGGDNAHTYVPSETGYYEISSVSYTDGTVLFGAIGEGDTLLDYSFTGIACGGFLLKVHLTAGTEYLIAVSELDGLACSYEIVVKKSTIESIVITSDPFSYSASDFDADGFFIGSYEGLAVNITFTEESGLSPLNYVFDASGVEYIGEYMLIASGIGEVDENGTLNVLFFASFMGETAMSTGNAGEYSNVKIVSPPYKDTYDRYADSVIFNLYDVQSAKQEIFYCYDADLSGLVVDITAKDGTVTRYYYDRDFEELEEMGFFAILGDIKVSPMDPGKAEVRVFCGSKYDTYEVTITDPGYESAEIVELPEITSSVKEGYGCFNEDGSFYYYTDMTDGLAFDIFYNDGSSETVYATDPNAAEDIVLMDSQLFDPWDVGDHEVAVFYKNYPVGSFDFTVLDKEIASLSFLSEPTIAVWYPEDGDLIDFNESELSVRIEYSDGSYDDVWSYEVEIPTGSARYLSFDFKFSDDGEELFYGFVRKGYFDSELTDPLAIYGKFEKIANSITSFEVTNEAASIVCIRDVGYDLDASDFTGLSLKAVTSDGAETEFTSDCASLPSLIGLGDGYVEYATVFSETTFDFLYRGMLAKASVTEVRTVADYVTEAVTDSTEVTATVGEDLAVYSFTAKHDGTVEVRASGETYDVLPCISVFDRNGYLITEKSANCFDETEADGSVVTSFQVKRGDTYYFMPTDGGLLNGGTSNVTLEFDIAVTKWSGDIDGDGIISSRDLLSMKKYLTGSYSDEQLAKLDLDAADADGDGTVSARDLLKLKRMLLGID